MACFTYADEDRLLRTHLRLDGPMPFAEPGAEPQYGPSRSFDITHCHLELDLYPEQQRFEGRARLDLHHLPTFAGRVVLDLEGVEVAAVVDGEGAEVDWSHDGERLHVRGDATRITVSYAGRDPRRGLYFTGPTALEPERRPMAWTQCQDRDGHHLFPCQDHPSVRYPWTVVLTGPAGTTLLGNGQCVEEGEREGRAYARYEQREPMPPYLFTAVCAELSTVEASWEGRPVRYHVPVGREEDVALAFAKTPLMIEHFSTITGVPYPWPRYDQVVVDDFIFGGMENVACTTMIDLLLVDEAAALHWDPDRLVSHELAHQWFGDLVTCQDWSQGWLNESWATFMETVWWEADRDEAETTWYRYAQARTYWTEAGSRYSRPIVSYDFKAPIDVFDAHLYEKGAVVLHTLRGELGDEAFWAGCRLYLERHAHTTVHSRHFQRAMEDATGQNLDRFFSQWITGAGHPSLEVELAEEDGLLTATVAQKQTGEGVAEAFALKLRLVALLEDGSERTVDLPVAERQRSWAIPVGGAVKAVRVDPGFRLLASVKIKAPQSWLVALLEDPCPVLAVRAARALLDKGTTGGLDAVLGALADHASWGVRGELASLLGKRGGAEARDALLEALSSDGDPRVLTAIATALGAFREAVVAEALAEALAVDTVATWHLEGALLLALGKTRDPRAREILEGRLGVGSWAEWVRAHALRGLAETRDPEVLDVLVAHTRPGEHPERVRSAAATALGALADYGDDVLRREITERLVEMLDEPGYRAHILAVGALAKARDPRALGALSRIHGSGGDGRLARSAYEAMATIRKGRTAEEGLADLRKKLDELSESNTKLRSRIEKLERHTDESSRLLGAEVP